VTLSQKMRYSLRSEILKVSCIFNSPTHPTPLNSLFRIHLVCNELHMGRMRNFTAKPETVDRHYVHS